MVKYNEFFKAKNIDEAWEHWYAMIAGSVTGSESSRDGAVVGEIINATTVIEDPTRCILKSKIRNLPMRYLVGELLWYLSGKNTLKSIQTITHAWDRMSDDGETVNSNYGWCIQEKYGFNQWYYVKELLQTQPNTRQAIIHIKTAENSLSKPTKDMNCTIACQFFLREGKLHMTTTMRSNDLWMGFPNDVFQFTAMQILMAMEIGAEVGTYTHHAGSLHLYQRDYEKSIENVSSCYTQNTSKAECSGGLYEGEPLNDK